MKLNNIDYVYTIQSDYYGRFDGLYQSPNDGLAAYRLIPILRQQFGNDALKHCSLYRIGQFNIETGDFTPIPRQLINWDLPLESIAQEVKGTPAEKEQQFAQDTADIR